MFQTYWNGDEYGRTYDDDSGGDDDDDDGNGSDDEVSGEGEHGEGNDILGNPGVDIDSPIFSSPVQILPRPRTTPGSPRMR